MREQIIASEMPVLPEVGSRIVWPGAIAPFSSASSISARATLSLTEPVGLRDSSFAQMCTPGFGERRGSSISGVLPIDCTMSPYRPPQGRFLSLSTAITSRNIAGSGGVAGKASMAKRRRPPSAGYWAGVSEENVELVRNIYRLWDERASAKHLIDPELEYVNPSYAVESGTRHSRGTLGKIREVYPDFRVEPERFVDAGEDVVVIGIARGTSASGLEAEWRQGYVDRSRRSRRSLSLVQQSRRGSRGRGIAGVGSDAAERLARPPFFGWTAKRAVR